MVFLKDILGDELYSQVAAKLEGTEIKLANIADGSFVDKATYDADIEKAKKEALASADTSELDGVKAENDGLKKEIDKLKFDSAIELKIAARHPKNPKAVRALIDETKLAMGENGVEGVDEQLDSIESSDGYLFGEVLPGGLSHGSPQRKLDGVEKAFAEINPDLKID